MLTARECTEYDKIEWIAGHELLMSPPGIAHIRIQRNLGGIIWNFLKGKRCEVFAEALLILDADNRFIPDLMIVCDKKKIKANYIVGTPDFAAEILSPSTRQNDIGNKKDTYEKFGVKEYWIIDPISQTVDAYLLVEGRYVLDASYHNYSSEDWADLTEKEKQAARLTLKISLYDDLVIDIKDIFDA